MADRYWRGGAGNWNDTSHWSTTSGGSGGASVPTSSDNAYFNANSGFTSVSKTVTLNMDANCLNMIWTGATNSPIIAGSNNLTISGNLTFINDMTCNIATNKNIYISNGTINFANVVIPCIIYQSIAGTVSLASNINSSNNIYFANSSSVVNTNNYNITSTGGYIGFGGDVSLGSSTITGVGLFLPYGKTVNAGTSKIVVTGYYFLPKGYTLYNVELNGTVAIGNSAGSGTCTCNNLKFNPGTYTIYAGETLTFNSLTATGSSGNLITLKSSTLSSSYTFSDSSGENIFSYCDIQDCNATGGATWNAYDGTNVNSEGNSENIVFSLNTTYEAQGDVSCLITTESIANVTKTVNSDVLINTTVDAILLSTKQASAQSITNVLSNAIGNNVMNASANIDVICIAEINTGNTNVNNEIFTYFGFFNRFGTIGLLK